MDKLYSTTDLMNLFDFSKRQVKALYDVEDFPVIKIGYKYFTPDNLLLDWIKQHKEVRIKTI